MLFRRRHPPRWHERLKVGLWPRRSWWRSFAYYRHRVLRLRATPHAVAAGVAAGIFASFTPFVGFHFLLSFVVAWFLAGSMIAAAFGTAAGNPLTFPFIWMSSFEVGKAVLGNGTDVARPMDLKFSVDLLANSFWTIWPTLKLMLVGGVILGAIAGTIGYVLTRYAVVASRVMRERRMRAVREQLTADRAPHGEGRA